MLDPVIMTNVTMGVILQLAVFIVLHEQASLHRAGRGRRQLPADKTIDLHRDTEGDSN